MTTSASLPSDGPRPRRVAMLMWGDVVEDFLAPIGWSLDDMLTRMSGGWFFGYIDALARHDVECVILLFTRQSRAPSATIHVPSGTRVRLVPWSFAYRALRGALGSSYDWLADDAHGQAHVPALLRPAHRLGRDLLPYLATPRRVLRRVLVEERCDAVLCQEYEEPRFDVAVRCGDDLGIPVFASFQGATARRSRFEAGRRPASMARAAGLVIGASRERRRVQEAYGVPNERIAKICNPLDDHVWFPEPDMACRATLGVPADAIVVVWHGRVELARKGLDVLLNAWRRLPLVMTELKLHLLLIGSGSEAGDLRRLIGTGATDITWVDRYIADRPAMRRYLSCADFYVLPSRIEGFPVAPLEAMACGLPVIASDAQGVEDIFERGELDGGIVVRSGDAEALAGAIVRLASDALLRASLGARARERVRAAFHPDMVGRQLAHFFFGGDHG